MENIKTVSPLHAILMHKRASVQWRGRTIHGRVTDTTRGENGSTFVALDPNAEKDTDILGHWFDWNVVTFSEKL